MPTDSRLEKAYVLLERYDDQITELEDAHEEAEHQFKLAWAAAIGQAQGSSEEKRKAEATLATKEHDRALRLAKIRLKDIIRRKDTLKEQIGIDRTLNASSRVGAGV